MAKQTWTTQDKRTLSVSEIPLDHLLNIVHDTHFRVARMRKVAVDALGGIDNTNVNEETRGAFLNVRPADVFPAWKTVIKYTKLRFKQKFKQELSVVRSAVFLTWEFGGEIHPDFEEAVRFLLCDSAKTEPPRLLAYLSTFRPETDEQYRIMCWNLRRDQPVLWTRIAGYPSPMVTKLVPRVPPNRLKSAMRFTKPINAFDMQGPNIWDGDIPFSAGR